MIVTNFEDGYTIKRVVLATPKRLFESWLDSREHGDMTGGRATIDAAVNGPLSLLDGAVVGRIVGMAPYQGIVHELNTSEAWEAGSVTRVEVSLATGPHYGGIGNPQDDGTTIILRHTGVDAGRPSSRRPGGKTATSARWTPTSQPATTGSPGPKARGARRSPAAHRRAAKTGQPRAGARARLAQR